MDETRDVTVLNGTSVKDNSNLNECSSTNMAVATVASISEDTYGGPGRTRKTRPVIMTETRDAVAVTQRQSHHKTKRQREDIPEPVIDINSDLFLLTRGFGTLLEYKGRIAEQFKIEEHFNFTFICYALDHGVPANSNLGPCYGLLLAVADVFGSTIGTETWSKDAVHWEALFDEKQSVYTNPVASKIVDEYTKKYDCRFAHDEEDGPGIPSGRFARKPVPGDVTYFRIPKQRLKQLARDVKPLHKGGCPIEYRRMFARYLVKLWEAKFDSRSRRKRSIELGETISNYAKYDNDGFLKKRFWRRTIIVPPALKSMYPGSQIETDADSKVEYDSESDDNNVEADGGAGGQPAEAIVEPKLPQPKEKKQILCADVNVLQDELKQIEKSILDYKSENEGAKSNWTTGIMKANNLKEKISKKKIEVDEAKLNDKCLEIINKLKSAVSPSQILGVLNGMNDFAAANAFESDNKNNIIKGIVLHATGGEISDGFKLLITNEETRQFKEMNIACVVTPEKSTPTCVQNSDLLPGSSAYTPVSNTANNKETECGIDETHRNIERNLGSFGQSQKRKPRKTIEQPVVKSTKMSSSMESTKSIADAARLNDLSDSDTSDESDTSSDLESV